MDNAFKYAGLAVVTCFVVGISAAVNGWALSLLWGWFIVPVFALPQLHLLQATGIGILVIFLRPPRPNKESNDDSFGTVLIKGFVYAIVHPVLSVFMGWILHRLM